jgi:hypothetical protein
LTPTSRTTSGASCPTAIAGRDSSAAALADARVEAGDEAGKIAPQARGLAVAVEAAPGAKPLRPEDSRLG